MKYCVYTHKTKRWPTRVVTVGNVSVGGGNPIRIQSMTTSNTRDVQATVEQIIKLADYGCEIVRVTVQGKKEAQACEQIKTTLLQKGYEIPLVADIHFYPPAAMLVADFVDKIRINPGNYIDRRAVFKTIQYTDKDYAEELKKIEEGFSPLVKKCKERKIAMRIGANHGSLSDRIMNRYGDTPRGMVESAIEFANICRMHDYHNFLFSMKASNPLVMQQSYRLLVAEMMKLGWDYPLHLGVTEAGEGKDGRVKSASGIGGLLFDGLGDTIRISLTEDPWLEIDPCKRLIALFESYENKKGVKPFEEGRNVSCLEKQKMDLTLHKLHPDGSVLVKVSKDEFLHPKFYDAIGAKLRLGHLEKVVTTVDMVVVDTLDEQMKARAQQLEEAGISVVALDDLGDAVYICEGNPSLWEKKISTQTSWIFLELIDAKIQKGRQFFAWMRAKGYTIPVILVMRYDLTNEDLVIYAGAEFGALLLDKMGNGIMMICSQPVEFKTMLSFSILQAARMRASKTDFIGCPGCGRTLFDIQSVTKKIQEKTSHLPGVKIAIMGCIVNGPGEMADADFGYVGSRTDKIDLYVGKVCVQRNIDHSEAVDRLIELIQEQGRWIEPEKNTQ